MSVFSVLWWVVCFDENLYLCNLMGYFIRMVLLFYACLWFVIQKDFIQSKITDRLHISIINGIGDMIILLI